MSGFSFAGALATGLDVLLNRPGSGPSPIPSQALLSSAVTLMFTDSEGTVIPIAEFDEMSKQKLLEEKKRFKPFGSMKAISLGKDNGWEITLSGQKTDGLLDRLIYIQEKMLNGAGLTSLSFEAADSMNSVLTKPLFNIIENIRHNNKSVHTYTYNDVSIIGYSEENQGDMNPITYALSLFSPSRNLNVSGADIVGDELESKVDDIIRDLIGRNKQ